MDDAVSQADECGVAGQMAMQHDLEKLQEAHDKLLQELEEKRTFSDKLHSQLDSMIERNDSLSVQLQEKEQDLEKAVQLLQQNESLAVKVQDSESKNAKLKQLAVKLKKELAEAKEELDRKSQNDSSETKDQLKQLSKENERLSSLYQGSARNFQNLQSDFDKLQDDYENVRDQKKRMEQDLTLCIAESTKLRVELEELKQEKEGMNKKIADLERDAETQFTRRKELEGKVIVFTNELEQEKKKLVNQAGLERTVNELRCQLDLKTTELVELGEIVEKQQKIQEEWKSMKDDLAKAENEKKRLQEENEEVKEKNWDLISKLEAKNTIHEQERVRVVELLEELKHIRGIESQLKEGHSKCINELEGRIRSLSEQLTSTQTTLSFTEREFEAYKVKVCRVLSEKTSSSEEVSSLKEQIATMQNTIETLQADKELLDYNLTHEKRAKVSLESDLSSRISRLKSELDLKQQELDALKKENSNFRTLSRELQCQLVAQRNQHEADLTQVKHELRERESNLLKELENEKKRHEISHETSGSQSGLKTIQTQTDTKSQHPATSSQRSLDDMESVESSSLVARTKRFSLASSSELGHGHVMGQDVILDEILNSKSDDEEVFHASILRRNESIERLEEMLQESESGSLLLTEQNRLLKEEIRRLERTLARIEVAQNLEYLKNLLVKFMSLDPGSSEKLQLVPVLKEILKLDSREEKVLHLTAVRDLDGKANQTNGWSFPWS